MFKEPTGAVPGKEKVVKESHEQEKKRIVLMTGTQMERPLRHLAGLIKEYASDEYEVDILNLGTKAGVYEHKDGGYPEELKQEVIDFLVEKQPAVIGITMIDYGVERLSDLISEISSHEALRTNGTKIVAGGPFAIEHSERCLDINGVDVVIYATGWHFSDIVKACEMNELKSIPGLMIKTGIREDGKTEFIQTDPPKLRVSLSDQPLPDESHDNTWRIYEGRLVNEMESGGAIPVEHHQVPHKHTGVLITSEGCPNDCEFCSIPTQRKSMEAQVMKFFGKDRLAEVSSDYRMPKVKFLSARQSVDLIRGYLAANPKTEYILFNDNDFAARGESGIAEFAKLYREEVGLPFYCQCSPNTITQRKIELLQEAGMDTFDTGVQGSDEANRNAGYERNCTDEQVLNVARCLAPYLEKRNETGEVVEDGVKAAFDFINGNEVHAREDMLSTIALTSSITKTIEDLTSGSGSWNLAIHNLTLDDDRELAKKYRAEKEKEGISVGDVEDSDYHNATVEAFYKLNEPYLNLILEWMGGLHNQAQSGRLPRKSEDFAALIKKVFVGEPEFAELIDRKKTENPETVDLLIDSAVYAFLGGKDNNRAKEILKKISGQIPDIHYSYQRPNRYDYDYSWAEKQITQQD